MHKSPEDKAAREFLTPPEIAVMLGVAHQKILNWIETNELSAVDLSSRRGQKPRWGVSKASLDEFLARRANRPQPVPARRRPALPEAERFY